jgi:hypothetical protein
VTTGITINDSVQPALSLGNPSGGQLQLVQSGGSLSISAPLGTIKSLSSGDLELQVAKASDGSGISALMYSSWNSAVTWPVSPFRVLDTRGLGGVGGNGTEFIINPGVLNSAGKLRAEQILALNLTPFVKFGYAVLGNATMQAPEGNGFLTIWPAGLPRPTGSNVNYLMGWPVSNGVVAALGDNGSSSQTDVLYIYSAQTTHLIFDVMGFIVPSLGNINPNFFSAAPAGNQPKTAGGSAAASRFEQARAAKVTW